MTELKSGLTNDGCHVKTVVNARTYTFTWTVENFSKFELETEKKSFTFHPLPNQAFYATLRINEMFDAYLTFHHVSGPSIKVKHNVSMEDRAGKVVLQISSSYEYSNSFYDVLPDAIAIVKKAREDDVLIIKCVMEFYGEDKIVTYFDKAYSTVSVLDDLSALSNEWKTFYDSSLYADVSLKVGDSILPVHKLVLRTRSPVFARMFETPMGEKEKNVVEITDLELNVLKDLVSYLYTGVLAKDDFELVCALYYAADKYNVSCLRKKCIGILLSKLDVDNACRVLALADQHSDVDFKNSVMDFIKFYFSEVVETDNWKELVENTPRLAMEFVTLWCKKSSDKSC